MEKILLVENKYDIAVFVNRELENRYYVLDWVEDGKQGYERLRAGDHDLVILDMELPGMNGLEICRRYRLNDGGIPILILSTRSRTETRVKALSCGVDDFLVKPFVTEDLSSKVEALLRRGQQHGAERIPTYNNAHFARQLHSLADQIHRLASEPMQQGCGA